MNNFKYCLLAICLFTANYSFAQDKDLKLVFIRHAEKPLKGGNLTSQGFNRSIQLPDVLYRKFGIPNALLVPALGLGDTTKHSRMFETIAPMAMKYNLVINTSHNEMEYGSTAADLKQCKGTIVITWEHRGIPEIVKALGIKENLVWRDDDYDSIWIVTFRDGTPQLMKDKEGLHPSEKYPF